MREHEIEPINNEICIALEIIMQLTSLVFDKATKSMRIEICNITVMMKYRSAKHTAIEKCKRLSADNLSLLKKYY